MGLVYCQGVATPRQDPSRGICATVDNAPIVTSSPSLGISPTGLRGEGLFVYPEGLTQVEAVSKTADGGANPSRPAMTRCYKARVCQICGEEFVPANSRQKYCLDCKREGFLARKAEYRKTHCKERAAYSAEYQQDHREQKAVIDVRYRQRHRDKWLASKALYRQKHDKEIIAQNAKYRQEHPEKVRQQWQKRRALKYGNTPIGELLTEAQWRDILDQYRHRCAYCGKKSEQLTIDHVIPLSKGGKHSANNVVPACQHCNCSKKDRTPEQWAGLHV